MKTCKSCNKDKLYTDFHKKSSSTDGYFSICKICRKTTHLKYYKNNKQKYRDSWKRWSSNNIEDYKYYSWIKDLKRNYGLTLDQYNNMLEVQNNKCAICFKDQKDISNFRLSVDHCHKTGKIRGLLCNSCNTAIGSLNDDTQILNSAINYLNQSLDNKIQGKGRKINIILSFVKDALKGY